MSGQPRRVRDKPRLLPLTNAITFNTKCLVFSELVNNDSRDVLADFTDVILVSEDTQWILTWTTQRLPEAEGRGRSLWRVRQGCSRVLVAASAWWARVTFVLLSELDGLPAGLLNLVEHLQQESIVTIVRHPFWRQNLNKTKNISGAQELTPFHFRGPSPFGGKLFPWEILDWAGFRNQLMLMHPELGERHNLYCFKS